MRFAVKPDPLTAEQRRSNMSRICGKDTKPELTIRRGLHARGLRYRLHDRKLPGTPDLVFPGRRAVIFVHGCFWHGHDCHLHKMPATNSEFWNEKIERNRARDAVSTASLVADGWRVLTIWECALRGRGKRQELELFGEVQMWLTSDAAVSEISGLHTHEL